VFNGGSSAQSTAPGTDLKTLHAKSAADLAIMRWIDEVHLDYRFAGSRMLSGLLRGEGIAIGRERVTTMMRGMRIEAIYRRPHTSRPADGHKVFPYLLRGVTIDRPGI
jgi:putative transposase